MILLGVSIKIFEFAFLYFTYIYYVEKFNDVKFILVIIVGMSITSLWFLIAYYLKKFFKLHLCVAYFFDNFNIYL